MILNKILTEVLGLEICVLRMQHAANTEKLFHACIFSHFKMYSTLAQADESLLLFLLQIHKHYSLFSSLPQIACLAFLSFQYPLLLFKGLKGAEKHNATEVRIRSRSSRGFEFKSLFLSKPELSQIKGSILKAHFPWTCACVRASRRLIKALIVLVQSRLKGKM